MNEAYGLCNGAVYVFKNMCSLMMATDCGRNT